MAYAPNDVRIGGIINSPVIPKTSSRGNLYAVVELTQVTSRDKKVFPVTFLNADQAQALSRLPVNTEIVVDGTITSDAKQGQNGSYFKVGILGKGFYVSTPKQKSYGGYGYSQQAPQQQSYTVPQQPQQEEEAPLAF